MSYRLLSGTARKVGVTPGSWPRRAAEARRLQSGLTTWETEGGRVASEAGRTAYLSGEYVARMEAQLDSWDAEVDALVDRGDRKGVGARAAHDEGIMGLSVTRDAAHKAFRRIRFASDLGAAELRAGMDGAWDAMQRALEKLSADLEKR
jgi:hypothetical protein